MRRVHPRLPTCPSEPNSIGDLKAINEIVSHPNLSVQELQARGAQPYTTALVEKHRSQLESALETLRMFAQGVQNATPQAGCVTSRTQRWVTST